MALLFIGIYLYGFGRTLQSFMQCYEESPSLQAHPSKDKFLTMLALAVFWPMFWVFILSLKSGSK